MQSATLRMQSAVPAMQKETAVLHKAGRRMQLTVLRR